MEHVLLEGEDIGPVVDLGPLASLKPLGSATAGGKQTCPQWTLVRGNWKFGGGKVGR